MKIQFNESKTAQYSQAPLVGLYFILTNGWTHTYALLPYIFYLIAYF
jgi:hypothetical protein